LRFDKGQTPLNGPTDGAHTAQMPDEPTPDFDDMALAIVLRRRPDLQGKSLTEILEILKARKRPKDLKGKNPRGRHKKANV
jgi:hypothetical protein